MIKLFFSKKNSSEKLQIKTNLKPFYLNKYEPFPPKIDTKE